MLTIKLDEMNMLLLLIEDDVKYKDFITNYREYVKTLSKYISSVDSCVLEIAKVKDSEKSFPKNMHDDFLKKMNDKKRKEVYKRLQIEVTDIFKSVLYSI